jgi:tetratricopeptide (TPR) repeat protein
MAKQYVVRTANGSESNPILHAELLLKIKAREVSETDEVAVYPGGVFVPINTIYEFEEALASRSIGKEINSKDSNVSNADDIEKTSVEVISKPNEWNLESDDVTVIKGRERVTKNPDAEETKILTLQQEKKLVDSFVDQSKKKPKPDWGGIDPKVQKEKTVFLERPKEMLGKEEQKKRKFGIPKKSFLILIMLALVAYEMNFEDEDQPPPIKEVIILKPVRPKLPSGGTEAVDPEKSMKIYNSAMGYYIQDSVQGYRRAVEGLHASLRSDPQNVKALAMLASSYINLIDSSNKDETTFQVINKLIELSRTKEVQLVETLMAEVEYLTMSRRIDAAIQRLSDHYKITGKFDPALYFYMGWAYSQKNDTANALKYLNQIPASALPIPKLYHLRGMMLEKTNAIDEAKAEYLRALKLNPKHTKSILGLVRVAYKKGEIKSVTKHVDFLIANASLQSPPDFVEALTYRAKLALAYKKPKLAVASLERALSIEPKNNDLRLEYYALLASTDGGGKYKGLARMYALVLEAENLMRLRKWHEATIVLIQARDAFPDSVLPIERLGDITFENGEYNKAQSYYKKATQINKKSGPLAIKYIESLIKSRDVAEAQKVLQQYKTHPKLKSSIDRLAGDLFMTNQSYPQALQSYRKAMSRDVVDTEVYSAYANALRELDQCKDAQFFFMLSQRMDPLNFEAILGSARCLLKTDGITIAVARIQDELGKLSVARADYLTGIAELYFLDSQTDQALQFTSQAHQADPEYPDAFRVEGEIYLKQMSSNKQYQQLALEALKAYSDRKPSNPYGYLQRFEIYLKESNFDAAEKEILRVFDVSPRYPELHYRRAQLYIKLGRMKDALTELEEELKINPRLVKAMIELGNIMVRLNRLDDGMKYFVEAMSLDPTSASAKIGAGYVNFKKKQFSSAVALYLAALAYDKGNPDIYKKLGQVYLESGERQKAGAMFRSYLDLAPDAPDRNEYSQYR